MRELGSNTEFLGWSFSSSTIRVTSGNSDTFGEKTEGTYRTAYIRRSTTWENVAGFGASAMENGK